MNQLAWIVLFLPLLAAIGITLFTRHNRDLSARISIGAIALGFVLSCVLFLWHRRSPAAGGDVPLLVVCRIAPD
jgi:NADH:ubiquinone oxidoreductase subunit 4 (subunit M)